MSRSYLSIKEELRHGDFLLSNNKEYKAVFQEDGNFVVYGWKPVWQSDTVTKNGNRLIMQEDCNFVMYANEAGTPTPKWHTNTHSKDVKTCRLTLKNDGILVVENDGKEVWKSTKCK